MAETDLRPMTLGEVLDRTFNLYKGNFWLFAGIVSWPYLFLFIFQVISSATGAGASSATQATGAPAHGAALPSVGAIAGVAGGALLFLLLFTAMTAAAHAATVFAVSDIYLGRLATVRGSFRQVRGKVLTVIGVTFLEGLILLVGFILLIIPGIILMCRMSTAIPAAMLEDKRPMSAINRSMELTKGFAWQVFLIYLLLITMSLIISTIFQVPFTFLKGAYSQPHALPLGLAILEHLSTFIAQVLVGPLGTIAFSLMYYNLRVRKEGFDLQHLMDSLGPSSTTASGLPGAPSPI